MNRATTICILLTLAVAGNHQVAGTGIGKLGHLECTACSQVPQNMLEKTYKMFFRCVDHLGKKLLPLTREDVEKCKEKYAFHIKRLNLLNVDHDLFSDMDEDNNNKLE